MSESVSEDMSPYCSAHDEWLIMKLCMYVGYHDANNVSNFGGDPVTQLNFLMFKIFFTLFYGHTAHHSGDAATGFAAIATRSRADCWSMEDRRRKYLINWPYQPKHSPSFNYFRLLITRISKTMTPLPACLLPHTCRQCCTPPPL